MRLIDADSLIAKYEQKMKENEGDKNALVLLRVLKDSVDQENTVDIAPEVIPRGRVAEYSNGMVAMREETYAEYNRLAMEGLPKRYIPRRIDAVEYLKALKEMRKGRPTWKFFELFPQSGTDEEKVAAVEKWIEEQQEK